MHRFAPLLLMISLAVSAGPAAAQELPAGVQAEFLKRLNLSTQPPDKLLERDTVLMEGPVDPESYLVGPGDGFAIQALGKANYIFAPRVDAGGWLGLGELGSVQVAGLTLAEASRRIREYMGRRLRDSEVIIRLSELRTFKVFVLGQVREPGSYPATAVTRASEVIMLAGGLTDSAAVRSIDLRRRDAAGPIDVDLASFLLAGDVAANPFLSDGDRVVVPIRTRAFSVSGAVEHPGTWDLQEGETLREVLDWIGLLPGADRDRATVARFDGPVRGGAFTTLPVDLGSVVEGGEEFPLQDGDRIYIRFQHRYHESHSVIVEGEVTYPGEYPLVRGTDRLSDLLERAGGTLPDAHPARISLERAALADTNSFQKRIRTGLSFPDFTPSERAWLQMELHPDANRVTVDLAAGEDPLLDDGDRIHVPRMRAVVRVVGQVVYPGFIPHREGWDYEDYIAEAGGTTRVADRARTRLIRGLGSSTEAESAPRIEGGDLLIVPEKRPRSRWEVARDVVGAAAQLATILIVVDQLVQPN